MRNATFTLRSNDGMTDPCTFAVRGTGQIPSAKLVIGVKGDPLAIPKDNSTPRTADGTDYGTPVAGTAAITRTFSIENNGTAALEIYGIATDNGASPPHRPPSPASLPASSRWFTLTPAPAGAGLFTADVTVFI